MRATAFTAAGSGATLRELYDAALQSRGSGEARYRLLVLARDREKAFEDWGLRTNLILLAGGMLTGEDLERIETRCEVA